MENTNADVWAPSHAVVVRHEGGRKFAAEVRGHRVETDQPIRAGGGDTAVMPIELLGTALGSCIALYVGQFCEARGLPTEGIRVEVDAYSGGRGTPIGRYDVRVVLPEPVPERYRAALDRVVRHCPVHRSLAQPSAITVALEAAEPVAV